MAVTSPPPAAPDAADIRWDLSELLDGRGPEAVTTLLDEADRKADQLSAARGSIAGFDRDALASFVAALADLEQLLRRAGDYAGLRFATDVTDPERGALVQLVTEREASIRTRLVFFDLEWAALDGARVDELLDDPRLDHARHYLRTLRRYREHLLSEPEEKVLSELAVTGRDAWSRLFTELTSTISVELDGGEVTLEAALSRLSAPDRAVRRAAAEAVTAALAPGLRTRAFVFNTLLQDKSINDRLRRYPHWLASRNLANEASDESVEALVSAVRGRYDIPHRWYALKAQMLGLDRIADYDRMSSLVDDEATIGWAEAKAVVLDSYHAFSAELGATADKFFASPWIDAPAVPGKRGGAFCAYTVPAVHPYVLLNWTSRRRDVLTLAHELGHACHAYLARGQGIFHQSTPLTLAETASIFGETLVFDRLLEASPQPEAQLALLAEHIEGAIGSIFRQTAMNGFENLVHNARRTEGELSVDRIGEFWFETQTALLGPAVEVTDGYRSWWSYIPHFIATPGYVYAYSYGNLLALSVFHQYEVQGSDFVSRYLHLLSAGGSQSPEELGRIVGCDLADPAFWDGGLRLVEERLVAAEQAAHDAGRLRRA